MRVLFASALALLGSNVACSLLVDTDRFNAGGAIETGDGSVDSEGTVQKDSDSSEIASDSSSDGANEAAGDSSTPVKGHLYVVGGTTPPSSQHDDYRGADVNADGSLGMFSAPQKLPSHAAGTVAVVVGDYAYVIGGDIFSSTDRTARFAKLTGGVPGAWQTTKPLPDQRIRHAVAATDKYIYVMGGHAGGMDLETVYFAAIQPGGFLGDWTKTASLPEARNGPCAARWNDNLYVAGGSDLDTVYRAHVNGDGTIASWVAEGKLSTLASGPSCAVYGNRFYVVGGYGHFTAAESAALGTTGNILGWTKVSLQHPHAFAGLAISGKWMYSFGGFDTTGDSSTDIIERAELTGDGFLGDFAIVSHMIEPRFFVTGFGTP